MKTAKASLTTIHPQMAEYKRTEQNTKEMACYKSIRAWNILPLTTFSVTFLLKAIKNPSCF